MRITLMVGALISILSVARAFAQEEPGGKLGGYVFGDYFYKVQGDSTGPGSQYSSSKKGDQAFQFRRIYLAYDHTISEKFAAQLLLEGNDKAFTDGKHGVFVKTAYLVWKDILPHGSFFIGLVPTPSWSLLSERVWNYRTIEKMALDFRGLGTATDIGVQLRGSFDANSTVGYVAMVANGTGQRPENDKYKKYYGSLSVRPTERWVFEGYGDFEPGAGDRSVVTIKGLAAYQSDVFTVGVEVFQQRQNGVASGLDRTPFGFSAFAWAPVSGSSELNMFGRFDSFDPDTKSRTNLFREMFIVAGLDYMPAKNIHFMPNIWINTFSDKSSAGRSRPADVVLRLTFLFLYR